MSGVVAGCPLHRQQVGSPWDTRSYFPKFRFIPSSASWGFLSLKSSKLSHLLLWSISQGSTCTRSWKGSCFVPFCCGMQLPSSCLIAFLRCKPIFDLSRERHGERKLLLSSLPFKNFYWSIVAWQCCVRFCCTVRWISHTYTYIPSFWISFPFRLPQSIE